MLDERSFTGGSPSIVFLFYVNKWGNSNSEDYRKQCNSNNIFCRKRIILIVIDKYSYLIVCNCRPHKKISKRNLADVGMAQ